MIFSVAAVFILVIAGASYVNLTTARSFERAREVGARKTLGVGRSGLIGQFMGEEILTSMLPLVLTVALSTVVVLAWRAARLDPTIVLQSDWNPVTG